MTYYITTSPSGETVILRVDGDERASFTKNPENSDWIAYQAWLAEGNTPEPSTP